MMGAAELMKVSAQISGKETEIAEPPYDFVLSKTGELICINEELLQIA